MSITVTSTIYAVILCAIAVKGAMAAFLVMDKKYEDGLIGRIALVTMALVAFFMIVLAISLDDITEAGRAPAFLVCTFMVANAVFMLRHVQRYLRWRFCGEGDWRGKVKPAVLGGAEHK